MKNTKQPTVLWGIAGIVLSLVTLIAVICGMNSTPALLMDHQVAIDAAAKTLECARTGDYKALGQMLYGSPNLGDLPPKSEDAESLILYAYLDSIQYEPASECSISGDQLALDVTVSCLDIAAVSASLQEIVPDLMNQIAAEKENESEIYDAEHNYQPDFIAEVLRTATMQVLAQQPQTTDREITLNLARGDDGWQIVPTQPLLQLLSGFVSE